MAENMENNQTQENTQTNLENQQESQNSQQNAGEKTFTQAEVDRIVQERLARVKVTPQNTQVDKLVQQPQTVDTSAFDAQLAEVRNQLVSAKVESVMAASGIKPERIERAARLVDMSKCVNKDGAPDTEKIKKEIEELVKDFPELKSAADEGNPGFKFGANSNEKGDATEIANKVSSIFGNKK